MTTVLLLCSIVAAVNQAPLQAAPDPKLIRIYLTTDDSGHPDELAARRASLAQLTSAIASRRKVFAIVDDEDDADIAIDVLGRGLTVPRVIFGGTTTTAGQRPTPMPPPTRVVQLTVQLSADRVSEPVEIKNKNRPVESEPGWRAAADDIAKQIEKWASDRKAKIFEARK